jgi:Mn2+/Fe2+ NRAMP family transporter
VGELYGIPRVASLGISASFLIAVVLTGSYRRVERVAIALGLFEFAFFLVAYQSHPDAGELARGLVHMPLRKSQLHLSRRRQYRRGDHAVDDFLPAVRRRR